MEVSGCTEQVVNASILLVSFFLDIHVGNLPFLSLMVLAPKCYYDFA